MIAGGIIPFLVHSYGDMVLYVFVPDAVTEKSEWKWDAVKMTIINLISRFGIISR